MNKRIRKKLDPGSKTSLQRKRKIQRKCTAVLRLLYADPNVPKDLVPRFNLLDELIKAVAEKKE